MPHITLNGTHQDCETNITILEAARRVGVAIPTLCHDERLSPAGTCRLCSVEIDGEDHRPIACREQVRDGMRIITDGPEIHAFRRQILSWMAARVSPKSFADEPDK